MKYQVVYYSETGNTEKIAKTIFEEIPGDDKDIQRLSEYIYKDADTYFLGFWIKRGAPSMEFLDFLSSLEGKSIALFATCGMGNTDAYYKKIERQVQAWLPENCDYKGLFICQGKMPIAIRKACEKKKIEEKNTCEYCDQLIENFDRALLRPDNNDIKNVKGFVNKIVNEQEEKIIYNK